MQEPVPQAGDNAASDMRSNISQVSPVQGNQEVPVGAVFVPLVGTNVPNVNPPEI